MKTILITGSTDGIGKLAAENLAKTGHHVILHGRNSEKLKRTVEAIKVSAGNENVQGFVADLSDLKHLSTPCRAFASTIPHLDVLINNAGVYKSENRTNADGLDLRFVVNYLSPCILTEEFLPLLNKRACSRVLNLSSAAQAPVNLEALRGKISLSNQEAYAQSKLALTMWSFAWAKKHPNINTIAVNPGSLLNTNMVKEAFGHHWSAAEKGGNILTDLALNDEYKNSNGTYFDNDQGQFAPAHADAYDLNKIADLLASTEALLNR